jgi:hypothetical protein
MDPGSADILSWIGGDPAVEVCEVAAHGGEPAVDRGRREPACVQPSPVQLDEGSGRGQRGQTDVVGPLEVLAQVDPIGLQRAAAVAGEECRRGELGLVKQRKLGWQHRWSGGTGLEHGHLNLP